MPARAARPAEVSVSRISARLRGSAALRRKRAASPLPVSNSPSCGTGPLPGARTAATVPSRSTASTPPSRGGRAPYFGDSRTSSLESVQVSTALGRVVGTSPPRPPHAGTRPRVRSTPSISRSTPLMVTAPLKRIAPTLAVPPPSTSALRPSTGSLKQRAVDGEHADRVAARPEVGPVHARHGPHAAPHAAHPLAAGDAVVRQHAVHQRRVELEHVDPHRSGFADDRSPQDAGRDLHALSPAPARQARA